MDDKFYIPGDAMMLFITKTISWNCTECNEAGFACDADGIAAFRRASAYAKLHKEETGHRTRVDGRAELI